MGSLQEGPWFREVVQLVNKEWGQDLSPPVVDSKASGLEPEFSALALLIFGGPDHSSLCGPVLYRTMSGIRPLLTPCMPVAAPTPFITTKDVCRHGQVSPEGQNPPWLRTTYLWWLSFKNSITQTNPSICILMTTSIFTDLQSLSFLTCQMECPGGLHRTCAFELLWKLVRVLMSRAPFMRRAVSRIIGHIWGSSMAHRHREGISS